MSRLLDTRRLRTLRFSLPLAAALLVPGFVHAQPVPGTDCPPDPGAAALLDSDDVCTARILDIRKSILQVGNLLCANSDPAATKRAEDRLAKDFGAVAADCGASILKYDDTLTQSYLYSWINGPSEGWGADTKVHGVKIGEELRGYRETITSSWGSGATPEKLPAWYKEDAAYAEAVAALVTGAREFMKSGSSWALNSAETKIDRFKTFSGAGDDDARVKFLKEMLGRIKTANTTAIPAELLKAYAENPPVRLNGPAGFFTQMCDPALAKDEALADAVALALASHLTAFGPTGLETLDSSMNALKNEFDDWTRAETAFGAEMTGAWMSNHVKKTYFADDSNAPDVSPEMARALAQAVNEPLRQRYGLPASAPIAEEAGAALGLAGSKFDSNDNLRVVFPGKCELGAVHHVMPDGSTGKVLAEEGWDPRGVYDGESFLNAKDFPISELVFKETAGTDKDKARAYDVVMKCGATTRKVRISIPPRPDTTEPIDFVTPDTAPPYEAMLADGRLEGMLIGGYHTRDVDVSVKALKEQGFREVSRNPDVSLSERFFEILGKKEDGKAVVDYFVKDAHANGYAFDAGMFRANKRGVEVVMEKRGPDGKPHRITVLGNKDGEGKEGGPEGYDTIEYSKFFDAMGARGDATTFIANFSCWSLGKSAFEWDGIRSDKVKYLPTDKSASYWENYWRGLGSHENTFQIVGALDDQLTYAEMRETYSNFDDEIIMPDDPGFVSAVTDSIKSHRAGSSGIPVRVSLQESGPTS